VERFLSLFLAVTAAIKKGALQTWRAMKMIEFETVFTQAYETGLRNRLTKQAYETGLRNRLAKQAYETEVR
jgi:hypothetical protein